MTDFKQKIEQISLADFPFQISQDTQYADVDIQGHVNNLVLARYYENARARFQLRMFGEAFFSPGAPHKVAVVQSSYYYYSELRFPQTVQVATGLNHIGTSSFRTLQAIYLEDRCVGACEAALVFMRNGKPISIPGKYRQAMRINQVAF